MTETYSLDDVKSWLKFFDCTVEPCGSRVTCNPPPADTDQDFLVQIKGNQNDVSQIMSFLSVAQFQWQGGEHYQQAAADNFMSFRNGDVNLIVTANEEFAKRHRAATAVCTRLNLMIKEDRIALFQAVLYGEQWNGKAEVKRPPPPETKF